MLMYRPINDIKRKTFHISLLCKVCIQYLNLQRSQFIFLKHISRLLNMLVLARSKTMLLIVFLLFLPGYNRNISWSVNLFTTALFQTIVYCRTDVNAKRTNVGNIRGSLGSSYINDLYSYSYRSCSNRKILKCS